SRRIRGVDPDQVARQADDLVEQIGSERLGEHILHRSQGYRRTREPRRSACTCSVVSALPAIPQSPLLTSSTTHHVTWRMFSPSIETIASVRRSMICC